MSSISGLETDINLNKKFWRKTCGLYFKHVTIVNDASSSVKKLKASLNDAARGIIYERHMFIVQATEQIEKLKIAAAMNEMTNRNTHARQKLAQWKGSNSKQSTRWQHISQLKVSAFCIW
jgi:hypothetical protein